MAEESNLPVEAQPLPPLLPAQPVSMMSGLPTSLQIFFNDDLFKRCQTVANYLAKAEGMAPRHLIGKPEACFAVVSRALTWRLDPYAVAMATYQTPGGQVGFYGSLCQAIIENSGRLIGGVRFEHYGEWEKLRGKFRIATSDKGTKYPVSNWKPEDEVGLGVTVSAQLKDEEERGPRTMNFDLVQAFPRNSTLWATDARTQICYTAVRRFSTSTVPTLFMGVPFDHENMEDWVSGLRDVTPPRPEPEEDGPRRRRRNTNAQIADEKPAIAQTANGSAPPPDTFFFADAYGEVHEFTDADAAIEAFAAAMETGRNNVRALEAYWENAARLISALRETGHGEAADMLSQTHVALMDEAQEAERAEAERPDPPSEPPPDDMPDGRPEPPPVGEPPTEAEYVVAVPMAEGMAANQWHMAARAKLKEMGDDRRPAEDYRRFREVNATALGRLQNELRSWFNMLDKEITRGAAAGA